MLERSVVIDLETRLQLKFQGIEELQFDGNMLGPIAKIGVQLETADGLQ